MALMGIDLAGSERRASGWAVLYRGKVYFGIAHTDNELIALTKRYKVKKVIIDAPLTLPKGRKNIEERDRNYFRECDLLLRKEGIKFFPIILGPMRMLTKRGIALKRKLRDIKVFEGFPGASYDRLGVARRDKNAIRKLLRKFKFPAPDASQDELDALILLLTLWLKEKGICASFKGKDGEIIAPYALKRFKNISERNK
jgi:predicted nuclease with RNAse H fold